MAFVAQAPHRFRGQVQVAGHELATLALHENGYELRYKLDELPQGYYAGPPSACAVEALLGSSIPPDDLVVLVLGGSPTLPSPYRVVAQGWSREHGYEFLRIENARQRQELRFVAVDGVWWFIGTTVWDIGTPPRRLWSVDHEGLHRVGDALVPTRTRIERGDERHASALTIAYKEHDTNPEFARNIAPNEARETQRAPMDAPHPNETRPTDATDRPHETSSDDEGWEDAGEPASADPRAPNSLGNETLGKTGDATQPGAPSKVDRTPTADSRPAMNPPVATVPSMFRLTPDGLARRGDLCRASSGAAGRSD